MLHILRGVSWGGEGVLHKKWRLLKRNFEILLWQQKLALRGGERSSSRQFKNPSIRLLSFRNCRAHAGTHERTQKSPVEWHASSPPSRHNYVSTGQPTFTCDWAVECPLILVRQFLQVEGVTTARSLAYSTNPWAPDSSHTCSLALEDSLWMNPQFIVAEPRGHTWGWMWCCPIAGRGV